MTKKNAEKKLTPEQKKLAAKFKATATRLKKSRAPRAEEE